jgi:carbamoyltransferase
MKVLGLSCFYHDSGAALVDDFKILAAAQEERFSRKKHDSGFPTQAVKFCLKHANLQLTEVDAIAFYENPSLKLDRIIKTQLAIAPFGYESFVKIFSGLFEGKYNVEQKIIKIIEDEFSVPSKKIPRLIFQEHHVSHASSDLAPGKWIP